MDEQNFLPELYFEWGFRELGFNTRFPVTWVDNSDGFWFEQGEKEVELHINLN